MQLFLLLPLFLERFQLFMKLLLLISDDHDANLIIYCYIDL